MPDRAETYARITGERLGRIVRAELEADAKLRVQEGIVQGGVVNFIRYLAVVREEFEKALG